MLVQDGHRIEKFPTLYRVDGARYDRVSAALGVISKPGLDAWKQKHGPEEAARLLSEAGALGTRVHAMVERVCRDDDPWAEVEGTDLEPYYRCYVPWHEQHVRQVIMLEQVLWSEACGYAGTVDSVAELQGFERIPDGSIAVLDVKTSRSLSWPYRLQTASYMGAILERGLLSRVDIRGIIHMSSKKPGTLANVWYRDHDTEWLRWLAALELYRGSLEWADDWKSW